MPLGDLLTRLGIRHVFGERLPGSDDPGVRDPSAARLLAEADGAVGYGLGACLSDSTLTVISRPGSPEHLARARSPSEVVDVLVEARTQGRGALAVELDFDVEADAGEAMIPPVRDPSIAAVLAAPDLAADGGPFTFDFVLAGSSVVRAGRVHELRALADQTGLGVLNVFTAKGLFRWDSPYHLGTAGLQLHDFALAGLAPDRPVLAIGVMADECPDPILRDAGLATESAWPITRAAAERTGSLSDLVRAAHDGPPVPGELYERLSAVVQPLYQRPDVPLNPARGASDVAAVLPEGGVVTLEPGDAGWWVARALPTTQLGSVRVPAVGAPGLAVAAAVLASMEGNPAVAVVEEPMGPETATLLELARARNADLVVAIWGSDGVITSSDDHRERLGAALAEPGVTEVRVPVDFAPATAQLVEAAGPLAAWRY
jgi:thiamine pyrophosphate-dependent acetolactate synthase large subunit-like protein